MKLKNVVNQLSTIMLEIRESNFYLGQCLSIINEDSMSDSEKLSKIEELIKRALEISVNHEG